MIIKNRFTNENIMEIADLRGANLRGANLRDANLRDADLSGADLSDADLSDADLRGAYLLDADLSDADLLDADLRGAYLRGADLRGAYLLDADLSDADLRDADLRGAYLRGAKNLSSLIPAQLNILPDGDLIGYKKCNDNKIVRLLIPKKAKRSCATGRKCRAEYVKVLAIDGDTTKGLTAETNKYGPKTIYTVGKIVKADKWDECRWNECSNGIHFFITEIEAIEF